MTFSFIDDIMERLYTSIGIDLGTANTPIYVKGKGIKLYEPSYIALNRNTNKVIAVGENAKQMEGRVPKHIEIIRPLKDGVITDFESTSELLRQLVKRIHMKSSIVGAKVIIGLPSKASPVEEKAVTEAVIHVGGKKIFTIEQPLAAAIGVGLPVLEPKGNMIIDIGGGTTQIAVISMGGSIVNENLKVAGDKLTERIVTFLRQQYKLAVGNNTAEEVKIFLGSAYESSEEISMKVKGSDVISGLPRTVKVQEGEIREVLKEPLKEIIDIIKIGMEKTPPELMSDIHDKGIVLTGGSSLLRGLDKLIESITGITVKIPKDPFYSVAYGLGELLTKPELFKLLNREKKFIKYQA